MIWSMGAGLIPVPVVDMFCGECHSAGHDPPVTLYDIDFKQNRRESQDYSPHRYRSCQIGHKSSQIYTQCRFCFGRVTMAVLSGATSYALGEAFKKHFETGGTMLDFDPARFKNTITKNLKKVRNSQRNAKSNRKKPKTMRRLLHW